MAALIPFGIDKETGRMREVGDVPRGRRCGCVCPCCKAGLVAKQGSEKEWHFAHDAKAENRPDKKCDISFESACRLFIIDRLKDGQIPVITTPAVGNPVAGKGRSRPVTKLEGLVFGDSEEYGDVKTVIKGYTLEVFLDYSSRVRPEPPEKPESTGVLAFPVEQVRHRYLEVRGGASVLAGIVKDMFAEAGAGKLWLYHPAIEKAEAEQVIADAPMDAIGSESSVGSSLYPAGGGYLSKPDDHESQVLAMPRRSKARPADQPGTYRCFACGHEWEGGDVSGRICPQCGSDRLSVFTPL